MISLFNNMNRPDGIHAMMRSNHGMIGERDVRQLYNGGMQDEFGNYHEPQIWNGRQPYC